MKKKYNKKSIADNVNQSSSACRFFWQNGKQMLLALALCLSPLSTFAQKISLGSCITRDGGQYKGEMVSGKPQGKGAAVYPNGDTYEGAYQKGKREGYGVYTFSDGEKYEGQWMQDQRQGYFLFSE